MTDPDPITAADRIAFNESGERVLSGLTLAVTQELEDLHRLAADIADGTLTDEGRVAARLAVTASIERNAQRAAQLAAGTAHNLTLDTSPEVHDPNALSLHAATLRASAAIVDLVSYAVALRVRLRPTSD